MSRPRTGSVAPTFGPLNALRNVIQRTDVERATRNATNSAPRSISLGRRRNTSTGVPSPRFTNSTGAAPDRWRARPRLPYTNAKATAPPIRNSDTRQRNDVTKTGWNPISLNQSQSVAKPTSHGSTKRPRKHAATIPSTKRRVPRRRGGKTRRPAGGKGSVMSPSCRVRQRHRGGRAGHPRFSREHRLLSAQPDGAQHPQPRHPHARARH